jgi:hypothetical protein
MPQLKTYFAQPELPEHNPALRSRIQKAADYFSRKLHQELLPEVRKIHLITDDKAVLKTAQEYLQALQKDIFAKHASFAASQDGFSTAAYLKAKKNAELQFVTERRVAATTIVEEMPKDVPHPSLYAQLLRWRSETASDLGVALREILRTRSLRELVQVLPITKAGLKSIRGIGEFKVNEFGDTLIRIIQAYCTENKIEPDPSKQPHAEKSNTRLKTLDLFKSGKTIAQIAAERDLAIGTIEAHLAYFVARKELNVLDIVPQPAAGQILDYFSRAASLSLAEAKVQFGDQYSYGELRMMLEHFKTQETTRSL